MFLTNKERQLPNSEMSLQIKLDELKDLSGFQYAKRFNNDMLLLEAALKDSQLKDKFNEKVVRSILLENPKTAPAIFKASDHPCLNNESILESVEAAIEFQEHRGCRGQNCHAPGNGK